MNDRVDLQDLLPELKSPYYGITPLPDEITFSFVARAALLTGATSFYQVGTDLFGTTAAFFFPAARLHCGFEKLASHFVGLEGYDIEYLLHSLSFLPLFQPFLSTDYYLDAKSHSCRSSSRGFGKASAVIRPGLIRPHAAVCPDCVSFDHINYYVGYYHRVHQISAVTVCPIHGRSLLSHCPACDLKFPRIPGAACKGCGCILHSNEPRSDAQFEAHLRLAGLAQACLSGEMPIVDASLRMAVLKSRAQERIRTRSGIVGDNLARHLIHLFGQEYLDNLGYSPNSGKTIGWPSLIIHGQAWSHEVVSQLLLISALFDSVDDFRDACQIQTRTHRESEVAPRRGKILWNAKILLHLIRYGDVKRTAIRHRIPEERLMTWIDTYPGLRARMAARFSKRQMDSKRKRQIAAKSTN